jgi:hypothetical protein
MAENNEKIIRTIDPSAPNLPPESRSDENAIGVSTPLS